MGSYDQITLRQVRYFLAVYEHGTVSGAAVRMRVSQPALGMQIRQLEATLGIALFERTTSGLIPTAAGKTFMRSARKIVATLKDTQIALQEQHSPAQIILTLGTTTTSGRELAGLLLNPKATPRQRSQPHSYQLMFREGKSDELISLLRDRRIDAALSYEESSERIFEVTPLYREEFVLVGTPNTLNGMSGVVSLRSIARLPLVVSPAEQGSRGFLKQIFLERRAHLNITLEMSSVSLKDEMLLNHGKCMIVPKARFFAKVEKGELAMLSFKPPINRTMRLFIHRSVPTQAREFLRSAIVRSVQARIGQRHLGWCAV